MLEMSVFNALNYNNEVFRGYITWGGILLIKMVLMSLLTGAQRMRKGVSGSFSDVINQKLKLNSFVFRLMIIQRTSALEPT